jgi:hypothetical protein
MSAATKHAAIRAYFASRWTSLGDGTTVVYENLDYTPVTDTAYIVFGIRPVESDWVASGWTDSIGAVVIAAMTPANEGPEAAETLAATVASCLARQSSGGVQFDAATVENIGPDGQGWYQVNVRTPYYYDESTS